MTKEHGAYAFDFFRSAWWCHRCRAHVASGPPAAVIALVTYSDVDSFVANVESAATSAVEDAEAALAPTMSPPPVSATTSTTASAEQNRTRTRRDSWGLPIVEQKLVIATVCEANLENR